MSRHRIQTASDVIRDGLGVELINERGDVVAEVFRNDAKRTIDFTTFQNDISLVDAERLLAAARERLGSFEDDFPLPTGI